MKITAKFRIGAAALLALLCLPLAGCSISIDLRPKPTQPAPTTPAPTQTDWAAILPGQWHDTNVIGSGYGERWRFDGSGKFIWAASGYDLLNRKPYEAGTWKLEGDQLQLSVIRRIELIGGEIVTDEDDEEYLWHAEERLVALSPPETRTLPLGGYGEDPESGRACLTIGGTKYYDYSSQPGMFEGYEGLMDGTFEEETQAVATTGLDSTDDLVQLAESTLALLKNKDWGALGALVHPEQGLTFSPWGYVDTKTAVRLGAGDVKALGSDKKVRVWGEHPSGDPIKCTFAQYYDMFIFDEDYTSGAAVSANTITKSDFENNLFVFGNGSEFVEFFIRGESSPEGDDYYWSALRLVFAGYEGELCLVGVVHDQWMS